MRQTQKYFMALSVLLLLVVGLAIFVPGHAAANGDCSRIGSVAQSGPAGSSGFDGGDGYFYKIVQTGVEGTIPAAAPGGAVAYYVADTSYSESIPIGNHNDPTKASYFVINGANAYINTMYCNGVSGFANTYGGSMTGNADEIDPGAGIFKWTDPATGTDVKPDNIGFGLPPKPATAPSGTSSVVPWNTLGGNSTLGIFASLNQTTSDAPGDAPQNANLSKNSAQVDDSGRMVIKNINGVIRTIWCTELNTSTHYPNGPTGTGGNNCGTDIADINPPSGTGFLFRDDQTCNAQLVSCTSHYWTDWYKGAGMYGQNNLTTAIGTDAAGYLNKFTLHYEARNTRQGGFGANSYFRLRYPKNGGQCADFALNGSRASPTNVTAGQVLSVHAVFTNTGTRPWRAGDGYSFVGTNPTGSVVYPASTITFNGQNVTLDTTINAPASTGTITWSIKQGTQTFAPCSLLVNVGGGVVCETIQPNIAEIQSHVYITLKVNFPSGYVNTGLITSASFAVTSPAIFANSGAGFLNVTPNSASQTFSWTYPGSGPGIQAGGGGMFITWTFTYKLVSNGTTQVFSSSGNPTCNALYIAQKPYFKIFGGDAMVGSGFNYSVDYGGGATPACTSNPNAKIIAWNQGSAGGYAGSSTSLGVFSTSWTYGFASQNGTGTKPPKTLTFANSDPGKDIEYGGNYGNTSCIPDFYTAPIKSTAIRQQLSGTINLGGYACGPNGGLDHLACVIQTNGNINLINSNQTGCVNAVCLTGAGAFAGATYADPAHIPSLYVITKGGNIYIPSTFTRLDGVYIAEPDSNGNGGNIYTCAQNTSPSVWVPMPGTLMYANCQTQLQVYGAFIAKQVSLMRLGGSTVARAVPGGEGASTQLGEFFSYSPALWLNSPFQISAPTSTTSAQFAAPPIL